MLPKISIITPSFQQGKYLAECLSSVHGQGYSQLEHLVVDGGSTDGSRTEIEAYGDRLAWWCSEPDRGQSHAINKGLARATGTIFGWLNSDDLLLPGALQRVGEAFEADPDLLIFGGRRIIQGMDGSEVASLLDDASRSEALFTAPKVNQQSTFYRMDIVRNAGGVDEALHYVMDLELWWRILFANGVGHLRFQPVDLAVFCLHDGSKTVMDQVAFRNETAAVLRNMAVQLEQADLVEVLDTGHKPLRNLRSMPLEKHHIPIVRSMITHFLLKWNHVIHERSQFEMMRLFRRAVPLNDGDLDTDQREWLVSLDRQLNVPGWLAFRVKRKFLHGLE